MTTTQQIKKEGKSRYDTLRTLRRLLSYITTHWQTKVTLILIIGSTALDTFIPSLIGNTIDVIRSLAASGKMPTGGDLGLIFNVLISISNWSLTVFHVDFNFAILGVLAITLVAVTVSSGVLNYLQRYALAYVSQKGSYDMRNDLYNSLLDQSFSFYDKRRTGQLMARATGDVGEIQRFFGFGLTRIISSTLLFVMVIYALSSINWQLTLLSMAFLPVLLLTMLRMSSKVRPLWVKIREQLGVITSVTQENLMGVRVVRGFAREDYEEEKFGKENETFFKLNVEGTKIQSFYNPFSTLLASIGIVLIIWYGGNQVIDGTLTIGNLVAFYFYINRLIRPVRMIGFLVSRLIRALASAERIFGIMDLKAVVSDREGAIDLKNIEGRIVFKDVWFSYDGENMVLKDINLDVKPGETMAILGATGSGKSSIINLIPRFYDVNKGCITVDDQDVRDVTLKSLRKHIGIVRQDPFIFSTTIKENIGYGVENAKLEEVEAAAKKARIHDFIASLPEGYETSVGERGVTLSGGQKQRITIARALLKDPKILILDDSTSSVDTQTEFEIQQTLEKAFENRTTFIITQRLSSCRNADKIFVLDKGEIVEEGTHEQLMTKEGIYYRLYQTQVAVAEQSGDEKEEDE